MPRRSNKPQLRTCTVCHKPGHNKSRCPDFLRFSAEEPGNTAPSVKMYLHENLSTMRSPHLVDLKPKVDPWAAIESVAPEVEPRTFYHYRDIVPSVPEKIQTFPLIEKPKTKTAKPRSYTPLTALFSQFESWRDNRAAAKALAKMESKLEHQELTQAIEKHNEDTVAPRAATIDIDETGEFKVPESRGKTISRLAWRAAIIAVVLIVPFQANSYYQSIKQTTGEIAANGTEGFMALQESTAAIMQADLPSAESSVADALKKFDSAVEIMNANHRLLQKIAAAVPIVSNEVQSRQKIITAGQKLALGNTILINGLSDSQKSAYTTLTERIAAITSHLKAAIPDYNAALDDLSQVDPGVLPLEYQSSFKDFRLLFAAFLNDLNSLVQLGTSVDEMFGGKGLRRYLIVFQNPNEIRPTGGFLGSFALVDVKDGKITKLDIPAGGSYDLQGQLDESVEPPTPLLLSNKQWQFQDANWFPDFPASAEKMLWFYRHSRQVTADGVIAVNATVLERLLAILGPVSDEKRGIELTAGNALLQIQQIVEEGPEKILHKPKQIITDLAPQLLSSVYGTEPGQAMPLMVSLSEALQNKEIQAYFTDDDTEQTMKSFGWSGQILPTKPDQDYLMVVNANIRGQKSDASIKQTITHQAVIADDGTITDTVVVTREHTGIPGEKLYGQTNIDYIRVYVPQGSELISAGGFIWPDERSFRAPDAWTKKDEFLLSQEKEIKYDDGSGTRITEEFGKTAFGNWLILEPGETKQVQFTYRLPFKANMNQPETPEQGIIKKLVSENYLASRYQLIVQKQSGQNTNFESQIIYPAPWHPSWNQGDGIALAANGLSIGPMELTNDEIWSLVMRKEK